VAALLLVLAGVAVFVLTRDQQSVAVPAPVTASGDAPEAAAPPPTSSDRALFDGWDHPAAVLLFTGEQHGYLEPCGCTAGQVGGMGRRMDLARMLREDKGWSVAGFDLGGALRDERAKRLQEGIKYRTTRSALREIGYEAQAIGSEELRFGADSLFQLYSDEKASEDTSPRIVCANVTLYQDRDEFYAEAIGIPEQFRIVDVGGLKVAVTAIAGEDTWMNVFPGGLTIAETVYGFEAPAAALKRVIPLIQAEQPDVLVLLSHTSVDASRDLAAQFPVFDVVVSAGSPEDGRREPGLVGETLILEVGQKGKTAGVLGVFPQDSDSRLKFQLVELNGRQFQHAPKMHELFEQYVETLNAEHPNLQESLGPHPGGAQYVGAEACQKCHSDAYDVWKKSGHARAFESLTTGRPDAEDDDIFVERVRDPECITCHATGWDPLLFGRYDSAFVDLETTPRLAGSQCENCHGPGSKHVEAELEFEKEGGDPGPVVLKARLDQQLSLSSARENLCVQCHDLDNSPKFDSDERPFDDWWEEIAH
jgi:hypothetical protein